jgi:hypothetical protein
MLGFGIWGGGISDSDNNRLLDVSLLLIINQRLSEVNFGTG